MILAKGNNQPCTVGWCYHSNVDYPEPPVCPRNGRSAGMCGTPQWPLPHSICRRKPSNEPRAPHTHSQGQSKL